MHLRSEKLHRIEGFLMKDYEIYFPTTEKPKLEVTDVTLYNYDFTTFSLTPLQEFAKNELLHSIKDQAFSKMSEAKIIDKLANKGQEEYIANLTDYAQEKLKSGEWKFGIKKDTEEMLAILRDTTNGQISSHLTLDKRVVKDLGNLPELSAIQGQLANIAEQIENMTRLIERVEQGQYNDRFAGFFSARQLTIEGLAATDKQVKKDLLISAARTSNETIAKLMLAIHHDTHAFMDMSTNKREAQRIDNLIQNSFGYLNSSIQLNLAIYTALGEHKSVLSTVTNYQAFIQQTLLKELDGNGRTIAWKLDNARKGNDGKVEETSKKIAYNITLLIDDVRHNVIGVEKYEKNEG